MLKIFIEQTKNVKKQAYKQRSCITKCAKQNKTETKNKTVNFCRLFTGSNNSTPVPYSL